MKKMITTALVLGLTISASSAIAGNYKRLKTAAEFQSHVVGKQLVWDDGNGIVHANGTTNGETTQLGKYNGNWIWSNGFYCRNLAFKGQETGTNCQLIEVNGNSLRITRDRGKGRATNAKIQ